MHSAVVNEREDFHSYPASPVIILDYDSRRLVELFRFVSWNFSEIDVVYLEK